MAAQRTLSDSAADFLPADRDLDELAAAAEHCRGCELYRRATQTVFGAGSSSARVVLVGEQPGDEEDQQGLPFVGPAGRELDAGLEAAGIDRRDVYITNAVKHFKWIARGKRRLHKKPSARELAACRPWLDAELEALDPDCVVLLGATAAQAMLGASFRVSRQRGRLLRGSNERRLLATYHPSAILRAPSSEARHDMRRQFVSDLRKVARRLARA